MGVAIAMPIDPSVAGTGIPDASDHLAFVPARVVALVGNVSGTVAALAVAVTGLRRRPIGNGLIVAGVVAAAVGSAVAGLGAGGGAVFTIVAATLLYAGFVSRR